MFGEIRAWSTFSEASFFAFNTKLPEMAILASRDFTAAKKVTSSEARLDDP